MSMSAEDVLEIYALLEGQNIKIWLDGGWAVDALLGEQTREHDDLDIAAEKKDLPTLKNFLESYGYRDTPKDEDKMWDLVLTNEEGKEIEVHAFSYGAEGKVVEEEYWNGYAADSLTGSGTIAGREVRCVSVSQLVKTHDKNKRELKEADYQDMERLSKKFGVTF
ncbi:nucleotidyltransferase family protein [Acetobacteraceae bacterium]|nr:nucleotidyltransferase family protein [Candidatus Parcubacteria bacterium]